MTRDSIINDAIDRLDKYMTMFDDFIEQGNCENEWKDFMSVYYPSADSLVECGVWAVNIIYYGVLEQKEWYLNNI